MFKPMLASDVEQMEMLRFPLLASPKLDGIRIVVKGGVPMTRSLKPIRNHYARKLLANPFYEHLDGEIIVGPSNAKDAMYQTSSGIMSFDGEPNFNLHVFDYTEFLDRSFIERHTIVHTKVVGEELYTGQDLLRLVPQKHITSLESLNEYEQECLTQGYEGLILRDPLISRYKCGRSTVKEGLLLKLKRFADDEAVIVDFQEFMTNENTLEKDNLGYAKRSSKQEFMVGKDTLGSLLVKCPNFEMEFNIGSGFDFAMRDQIWQNRDRYRGQIIKFKYQKEGIKDRPRFPIFLGFRPEE